MQTETLKLNAAGKTNYTSQVEAVLKHLDGVRDVLVIESKQECSVLFDEKAVSVVQLQQALSNAGYPNEKAKPKHGQGGVCCGSCGG
ncbi:CCGSCS motif protein [Undibacterium sp. TJN25]|uniref:CCGSCS motif protein n=1 Tax=Undibacterium sp. TJN25 TaxID=3413056 RepID=UPI003BF2055D